MITEKSKLDLIKDDMREDYRRFIRLVLKEEYGLEPKEKQRTVQYRLLLEDNIGNSTHHDFDMRECNLPGLLESLKHLIQSNSED